jgi:hypothetical protein
MDQFVGQEPPAPRGLRSVLAGAERYVPPHGVRSGVERARRFRRPMIRVDPYRIQVMAKSRLEKLSRRGIQRPAGTER